ncbi:MULTISPECIES: dTDP-4-dehydrorhamnose 3,5-epimerase family protein [unclassified Streptomyces]|uniref:dTDP-4-dehydrorhamnose 3,5-epimerase family protein n=1 Tax=unclassified Streptomyces TaxID=2593676 RepID=UPI000CD54A59|nr:MULTISPECIES: dTDP-4-dehydrorhamnose 3,5-epimerase family protein [unclassified Streptomyces]AWL41296.1 dTDP-4-keto-6-deoxy-D-glucose epimerase [Streptomyces sp. SM18]
MKVRELGIAGAYAFTPEVFHDERGSFCSPLQEIPLGDAVGRAPFPVAQASTSRSRRGVVRGVHFTALPRSMAKYVQCVAGRALDLVVDVRVGSPTFGRSEAVELSPSEPTALYLPVGVGHLFVALEEDTVMVYLLSTSYRADRERALHPLDPDLGLALPAGLDPLMSARDREAPSLAAALAAGLLPEYTACRAEEARHDRS